MSKTTKRKHVLKEIMQDDFELPEDNQSVVRVLASKGNNLHEVESEEGEIFLVSMPTKFRKNIWVKRSDYILVEPIEEGDKVKAEMVKVLTPEHIKYFKKNNVWPLKFSKEMEKIENVADDGNTDNSSDDESDLVANTNRPVMKEVSSSDETDSDVEGSDSDELESDSDIQSNDNDDSETEIKNDKRKDEEKK